MAHRIFKAFMDTLVAALTPFVPFTRSRAYRSASWWPV